jgi:hypothetical protein
MIRKLKNREHELGTEKLAHELLIDEARTNNQEWKRK